MNDWQTNLGDFYWLLTVPAPFRYADVVNLHRFYLEMSNKSEFKAVVCLFSKSALPFVFSYANVVHRSSPPLAPLSPCMVFLK